jgi:hypothetical protein
MRQRLHIQQGHWMRREPDVPLTGGALNIILIRMRENRLQARRFAEPGFGTHPPLA